MDMTPMVDVVFQLMTFMLFSMQLSGAAKVDVPRAKHGVGIEESQVTIVTLAPSEVAGAKAIILLGDGDSDAATGEPKTPVSYDQVKQAVNDGVSEGRKRVLIQAAGEVAHGDVLDLATQIAEVKGVSIHIGVQEVK